MSAYSSKLKQQGPFFIAYAIFLIAGYLLLLSRGKAGSFLLLNSYHSKWLDNFFIVYTSVGDGTFAVLLSLIFFFYLKRRKQGLTLLIAYSFTGILTQIIKPIVGSPRPEKYFEPQRFPFYIDDIIHSGNTSFPSGHTVTAFTVATVLAIYAINRWWHLLFLSYAILVGFSRIYLSQHFLTDVLAGSVLGVAGAMLCLYWCRNIKEEKLVFPKKQPREHTTHNR